MNNQIKTIRLVGKNGHDIWLDGKKLRPTKSLRLINHSPSGFSWGYGGSGPAQLALAIMLEVTGSKEIAMRNYQQFKWDVISKIPFSEDFDMEIEMPIIN